MHDPSLHEWFTSPLGRHVLAQERQHLARVLPDLFGYHLVQVGAPGDMDFGESSRIHHRLVFRDRAEPHPAAAVVESERLPLASDSVDVVILPHVLEFTPRPHPVLREAERVLIGEGHLLVTAFSPWSLWGLWRAAAGWRRRPPWTGRFYSVARIRDWLSLLDFDVLAVHRCVFVPPLRRAVTRLEWLEHLGAALWPALGAASIIVARKRVMPLTPVRQRWQARRTLIASGLAEPSTRGLCK